MKALDDTFYDVVYANPRAVMFHALIDSLGNGLHVSLRDYLDDALAGALDVSLHDSIVRELPE